MQNRYVRVIFADDKLLTMNNKFIPIFLLLLIPLSDACAQLAGSHQPQSPPVNPGYAFTRGLYVDCADAVVSDVAQGNVLGLEQDLHHFMQTNSIGYIVLCGLQYSGVFGSPSLETALANFIVHTRNVFPGIQIGLAGSDSGFFRTTPYLRVWEPFGRACYPEQAFKSAKELEDFINDQSSATKQKRSEVCKFFFRAARLGEKTHLSNTSPCPANFDAFYVQYRYWNQTASLATMQHEFENFKSILSVAKALRCIYNCLNHVDAEFLPSDTFNLQGWTAIDQITEIDPLADRLMLPVFTPHASLVFDNSCKIQHFLTDRFSKPRSEFFIALSAESPSFSYCNSTLPPGDYLGNYLNGTTIPSGNMYSVEKMFLDKLNDPGYYCNACLCFAYSDNHYSPQDPNSNVPAGSIWGPYTMLQQNNLFRVVKGNRETGVADTPVQIRYYDLLGKCLFTSAGEIRPPGNLVPGLYLKELLYSNGTSSRLKILLPGDH
jgi:hypothetical protein